MAKNRSVAWEVEITDELLSNLGKCALACLDNASGLLHEVFVLWGADRFSRCAALAILAEEEAAKAYVLFQCHEQKKWNSDIYNAIRRDHGVKQAISFGLYKNLFKAHALGESWAPEKSVMEDIKNHGARTDKFKQSLLYVDMDEQANLISSPERAEFVYCLDAWRRASAIEKIVSRLLDPLKPEEQRWKTSVQRTSKEEE